jgi:hypothetical protein
MVGKKSERKRFYEPTRTHGKDKKGEGVSRKEPCPNCDNKRLFDIVDYDDGSVAVEIKCGICRNIASINP